MNLFGEQTVKILPMWQAWASLAVLGEKKIETRSWNTDYRGVVVIHATKTLSKENRYLATSNSYFIQSLFHKHFVHVDQLPLGGIIGSVELFAVFSTEFMRDTISAKEREFGDYSDNRFAWMLRNPVPLKTVIPYKGQQGMWNAPDEIRQVILESRSNVIKA